MNRSDVTTSLRLSGQVRRYHAWPVHRTQTNGEHSWQMMRIYYELFGIPPAETAFYILVHDSPEISTGDIPFPNKSQHNDLKAVMARLEEAAFKSLGVTLPALTAAEIKRVKTCDLIEMMEYAIDELMMGNLWAYPIRDDTRLMVYNMWSLIMNPNVSVQESEKVMEHVGRVLEKSISRERAVMSSSIAGRSHDTW